jgi:hypothetical protein
LLEAHAKDFADNSSEKFNSINSENGSLNSCTSSHRNLNDIRYLDLIIGRPPNPLYIGCNLTMCKLLRTPTPLCCLELNKECEHKSFLQASDYRWRNKCIIVVAEQATNGLFNFILPLRAQVRSNAFLKPIVLLLEYA